MRKRVAVLRKAAVALVLAAGLAGCNQASKPATTHVPTYFTCDTRGRLEPCGCFTGQFGGLTRLKTVLDTQGLPGSVRVDVGDAIGGREDFDLIQYRYMLKAFEALNYDALNVGWREAQLAAGELRQIKASTPVPILSANLIDKTTGRPIFDPYRIVVRSGYRIALVGVLEEKGLNEELGAGLKIEPMASALSRVIPELRAKADMIVLLAFADEAGLSRLAEQFYEIHVILGGRVSQPAQELRKENRSLIYFVTNESRALGFLECLLGSPPGPKSISNEIVLLHDRIPQDESFRKLAGAYRDEIRRTRLSIDDPSRAAADMIPGVRRAGEYVGSARCVECHKSTGAIWAKSAHSRAFATLVNREADADPKCISCHATGFGNLSGYQREMGKSRLTDVGCESCHGPGSQHVRQREGDTSINFAYRKLGAGDCQKCHYGEFSRPFQWAEFWPVIQHGKEPRTEGAAAGN